MNAQWARARPPPRHFVPPYHLRNAPAHDVTHLTTTTPTGRWYSKTLSRS